MSGRKTFVAGDILLASELNGFLMDQVVMVFDDASARTTAIPSPDEGMVTYLRNSNSVEVYNGSAWVHTANAGVASYRYVDTLYFASNDTFTKASYPWLRAIRVKVQGGGGGGGGCEATGSGESAEGAGGGGGGYGEKFITNIAGLASSVTVTRGAGGLGATAGANNGATGGGSSAFGITGNGGGGGTGMSATSTISFVTRGLGGGTSGGVDFSVDGGDGNMGVVYDRGAFGLTSFQNFGGGSFFAGITNTGATSNLNGVGGREYGGGGTGGRNRNEDEPAKTGGAGGNGIVIVELYA